MPLLFSILEHYNLLSKQPNYTCGLFFYDLMFMVVSWARAILSISKKAWTFPARPYYYILSFPKINRKPNNSKTEGRKGHTGPPGQPRGEELPCRFLSRPMTLSLGQPQGEELPCRLLSPPGSSQGDILGPRGSPMWGRAALQVPLLSHDFVMDWVHPGGSRRRIVEFRCFSSPQRSFSQRSVPALRFLWGLLCHCDPFVCRTLLPRWR